MTRVLQAELLAAVRADVGEGPLWNMSTGLLSWVDIRGGSVHLTTEGGEELARHMIGQMVGAALPRADGGFLLAAEDGFLMLSEEGEATPFLPMLAERPELRFNDAKCDPAGRAFAGSMAIDKSPAAGSLYRLDVGPKARPVLDGLTVANGLGWSPDGGTFWFADSAERQICGFDYDPVEGGLGARRVTIPLQQTSGVPDGFCVDDEGGIWLALWGGGAVHRYLPDGRLDAIIRVPARNVTSCAFGGANGDRLFITTARRGVPEEELGAEPEAGGLFVVLPGFTGPAATPWRPI